MNKLEDVTIQLHKYDLNFDCTTVNLSSIYLKASIDFTNTNDNAGRFYVYMSSNITKLEIRHRGQAVPFKTREENSILQIELETPETEQSFSYDFSYVLEDFKSRNIHLSKDYFFLLPDLGYLPRLEKINKPKPVEYSYYIQLPENYKLFTPTLANVKPAERRNYPPAIVGGKDFQQLKNTNGGISAWIPKDVPYNEQLVRDILESSNNLFDQYTSMFGQPRIQYQSPSRLDIIFVGRSGGYAFEKGLLLDENYALGKNENFDDLLAHEIAHQWWGQSIQSDSFGLTEVLAEYSSSLTITSMAHLEEFYFAKALSIELGELKPINFHQLTPFNNQYREYAYNAGPSILYEIQHDIGKESMLGCLKQLHVQDVLSYENLFKVLDKYKSSAKEAKAKFVEQDWNDFYIKSVRNTTLSIASDIGTENSLPVQIKFESEELFLDTFYFVGQNQIIKSYEENITEVIIDPHFIIHQLKVSNDSWAQEGIESDNRLVRKRKKSYSKDYYEFVEELLDFLLKSSDLSVTKFSNIKDTQKLLKQAADNIRALNFEIKGYELFMDKRDHNEQLNQFNLVIVFALDGKTIIGNIAGTIVEVDKETKIGILSKIKI